jgi:hypothetical protein
MEIKEKLVEIMRLVSLTVYGFLLGLKIQFNSFVMNIHRYRFVSLQVEDGKPFVMIDGEKICLEMRMAKPLKGIRIGNEYFTTKEEDQAIVIKRDFNF